MIRLSHDDGTFYQVFDLDKQLALALHYCDVELPAVPVAIVAAIEGEHDGADWHWVVRLADGQHAYVTGGCDNTGWDCIHSSCEAHVEPTLEAALRQVGEAHAMELREQAAAFIRAASEAGR